MPPFFGAAAAAVRYCRGVSGASKWTPEQVALAWAYGVCSECGEPRVVRTQKLIEDAVLWDPRPPTMARRTLVIRRSLECPNGHEHDL